MGNFHQTELWSAPDYKGHNQPKYIYRTNHLNKWIFLMKTLLYQSANDSNFWFYIYKSINLGAYAIFSRAYVQSYSRYTNKDSSDFRLRCLPSILKVIFLYGSYLFQEIWSLKASPAETVVFSASHSMRIFDAYVATSWRSTSPTAHNVSFWTLCIPYFYSVHNRRSHLPNMARKSFRAPWEADLHFEIYALPLPSNACFTYSFSTNCVD